MLTKLNLGTVGVRLLEFTFGKLCWCWDNDARMHMLWNSTLLQSGHCLLWY